MKPLKSLLYAILGLLLFGIQTQAQTPDVIPKIESEYGISIRPGGNTFPTRKGFATYLAPIVSDSTLLFYYDIPGRRILIDFSKLGSGAGVAYTPGVGLTLVNKEFGIKQWPSGDVGHIGVKSLNWAEVPQVLDADVLSYSNAKFLMQLGNNTVAMTMGGYQRFLANAFGIGSGGGSGSGSSLRWVTPPQNQNSPGEIGDISYYLGYWYMVGKDVAGINQWYRWDAESQFNSGYTPPSEAGKPGLSAQYNAATNKVVLNWSYDRTDAASWDVFVSFVQNNQYQLIKSGIPAGDRTYSFDNTASAYYIKVRAPKVGGSFTDFSDSAYVQPVQQLAYQPVSNVVITPKNGSNSFDFVFNTADAGGIATLWISTNVNASANTSDGWTRVTDLTIGNAGTYTINAPGITDTQGRVFKVQRSGGTLTPSVPQKFGPSALSSVGETLNAPTLVSAGVFSGAPNAAQITFLLNNQNVNSLILRQSEDNGATWTLDRSVTDPNTSSSYTVYGLTAGKTYTFQLYAFKNGNYSPYSETKSVTLPGGSSDQICNVSESASGGYQVTTKSYTITKAGTVYYMFDAGTIPDQFSVKRNGTTVSSYDAKSWRTAGQIAVAAGDQIDFVINPTVTYDQGTGWTLYANCSAAYNVNAAQPNQNYANNDYPRIAAISTTITGNNRSFDIAATPAVATGSPVVQSKAVRFQSGQTYLDGTGWRNGLTLTTDQSGAALSASYKYTVYVKDAGGKVFGIAQVDASKTYESDPSTQPLTFSIASQTPSALTLNVNNPSTTGVYNWSVYSGDPNTSGTYVDGKTNIAGGATLTIDLTSGKYVTGQQYRAYPAQNNGEPALAKQTRGGNYVTFTYQGSTDAAALKTYVISNSFGLHGPDPSQGWTGNWGMAASAADKDFVSQFRTRVKSLNTNSTVTLGEGYLFELNYNNNYDFDRVKNEAQPYDVVFIRLGENVDDSQVGTTNNNLAARYAQLIDVIRQGKPSMKFLISTAFWNKPNYDQIVRNLITSKHTSASPVLLVDLSYMVDNPIYMGYNEWPNASEGVKRHAGDRGMSEIAQTAFVQYQKLVTGDVGGGNASEIVAGVIPQGVSTNVPNETKYLTTVNGSRIGFNYAWGGAITEGYLTHAPTENLVNNMDFGRQIQYAYYGWPIGAGFRPQGKSPGAAQWENIGWDPIQAGDFTTPSRVLQYKYDQANNAMYYRTKPRMWGYPDVECECHVDTWVKVNGNALEFTNILTNYRTDTFESNPRGQDIGGGFLNSYYRYWSGVVTDKPWTDQPITTFDRKNPQYGVIQVESDEYHTQRAWLPENWAHNSKNGQAQGLGIWSASPYFAFSTVSGLEVDANTSGPFAATFGTHKEMEHIDRKQVLRYDYAYVIGTAQETRNYAYSRRSETWNQINFDFTKDRQGWWTNENFPDGQSSRYPFEGYWEVKYDQKISNFGSAEIAVPTSQYTKLEIEVAVVGGPPTANINLLRHRNNGLRYNDQQGTAMDDTNYSFAVTTDGQFRKYTIDLTSNPAWANSIVSKIYLDFGGGVAAGRMVRLKSIKGLP